MNRINVGDKILLWEVIHLDANEILLEWHAGPIKGLTWLHMSPDQRHLLLGSSIGNNSYHRKLELEYKPLLSLIHASRVFYHNPYNDPIADRIRALLTETSFALVIGGHQWYSRLLLSSTLKSLVLEK